MLLTSSHQWNKIVKVSVLRELAQAKQIVGLRRNLVGALLVLANNFLDCVGDGEAIE
jgi:hypothetical protein